MQIDLREEIVNIVKSLGEYELTDLIKQIELLQNEQSEEKK